MVVQSACTMTEWHCNSFNDLIDKMELWDWKVANRDVWSQLVELLQSPKVSVTWSEKMDPKLAPVLVPEKMSWATATRSIQKYKNPIEKIGEWCDRCLLITKRPKAPYLIWVLCYIPYMGLNGVRFCDCSCSCVYCDFEFLKFVFSTLRSRSCFKFN